MDVLGFCVLIVGDQCAVMVVMLADAQQLTVNFFQLLRYGFELRIFSRVLWTTLYVFDALKLINDILQDRRKLLHLHYGLTGSPTPATALHNQIYCRIIRT